ncbi:MAG TPA: flagellar biosynthetic protein FliR [Patescibacteria group bacterium]|nr:flagellar biosynthetic protein FliR [Patescibacteria group bacterium]
MFDAGNINFLSEKFLIGILLFIRVMGMLGTAPFYGHTAIPAQVKIILGIIIAAGLSSAFQETPSAIDLDAWNLAVLVFKEFLVGALIGFSCTMVFTAARFAGGLIDFDMGFQTALLFDPSASAPTLIGELKALIGLMIFLFINGHHFLIESLFVSIQAVPIGTFVMTESSVNLLVRLITTMMILGVKIAAPVLVAIFLTNLGLALLARVAPQMNVFSLSFHVKIVVGLSVLTISIPLFVLLIREAMNSLQSDALNVLLAINGRKL